MAFSISFNPRNCDFQGAPARIHWETTTFAPPWPQSQLPLFTHMLGRAKYGSVLVIYMSQCRPLQIPLSTRRKIFGWIW